MNDFFSRVLLIALDISAIFLSIILAYELRTGLNIDFTAEHLQALETYTHFSLIYILTLFVFFYEGIYTRRYDFWHESYIILRALVFAFVIVLAYLAMSNNIEHYSRIVITFMFLFMVVLIPIFKNIGKKMMFRMGIWRREAKVYGEDRFISEEIFGNPYLGYVKANIKAPKTIFINSKGESAQRLRTMIDEEIDQQHEVIFIPLIDEYDLTKSHIYELSNTRNNLIVFQNRLKSRYRIVLKYLSDIVFAIVLFPIILPLLGVIALLIKREHPASSILFEQVRMGKENKPFNCYKFRTMHEESDDLLKEYLDIHPEEREYYEKYHKYQNDPRVTNTGAILRKLSLDELPQIFNVIKNEMSFVGPRPYMLDEKEKMGKDHSTILTVRPGITGLWQVSGRSNVGFEDRLNMDVWYIRNWNLWLDLVILIKTFKTVVLRIGAS